VEYARGGGRINTDALDNSAGVDCSDHEVNIKIAMSLLEACGCLEGVARDDLLHDLEPDVGDLVLANNVEHNATLGVSRRNAVDLNDVHARQVAALHDSGDLDRDLTGLPSAEEFAAMTRSGHGLLSPDLATLMAHTKLAMKRELLAESALDGDDFHRYFVDYFPTRLRSAIRLHGGSHPLRRDIVATTLVNHMVAVAGPSFVHRLREQTGATTLDAARAFQITTDLFGIDRIRGLLDGLELDIATADKVRLAIRLLIDRCGAALVNRRRLDPGAESSRLRPAIRRITEVLKVASDAPCLSDHGGEVWTIVGGGAAAAELREWLQVARVGPELLDVADIAVSADRSVADIAATFFAIHRRLRISELGDAVNRIDMTGSQSHFLARLALATEITAIPRTISQSLLSTGMSLDGAGWHEVATEHATRLADIDDDTSAVLDSPEPDIECLLVLLHRMKNLAAAAAM
jgi:glutamate dehydrogenase